MNNDKYEINNKMYLPETLMPKEKKKKKNSNIKIGLTLLFWGISFIAGGTFGFVHILNYPWIFWVLTPIGLLITFIGISVLNGEVK